MKIANFNDDFAFQLGGGIVTVATTVSGDITGTIGDLTVTAVNGVAIPGTPSAGARLESTSGSAAAWVTMFSAATPADVAGAGSVGTATAAARSDHVHAAASVGSAVVSGTPATGKVLEATGTATASWQYPELSVTLVPGTAFGPYAAAGTALYGPVDGTAHVTRAVIAASVAAPNSGSAYWTLSLLALGADGSATTLGTATTAAVGAGTASSYPLTIGTATSAVRYALATSATGTPGAVTIQAAVYYRRT